MVTGADPARQPCSGGLLPGKCIPEHIADGIKAAGKGYHCPLHDDHHGSLSINPGNKGRRVVWHCGSTGCPGNNRDGVALREWFANNGVDESCLGLYGAPRRALAPGMPDWNRSDPATNAAAKRWYAAQKLMGGDLDNISLLRMCFTALAEGDGDLPGDPERLLPHGFDEFCELAKRAGIERRYKYQLYRKWIALHP